MRNWFDHVGGDYRRYRPDYPAQLSTFLAGLAPDRRLAVDVGCGNGQLTRQLAGQFDQVLGFDASADQIAHAQAHGRVRYQVSPAEALPVPDHSASLITAAQAAHWFDLTRFYAEVERIAAEQAILALITYGPPEFEAELQPRFEQFYEKEIGPYWPPERLQVDNGYAGLPFPYPALTYPELQIRREWDWTMLVGYLSTWSAMRGVEQAGRMDIVDGFLSAFQPLWGDAGGIRPIRFTIRMRLARLRRSA